MVKSIRELEGRALVIVNGASIGPIFIVPVMRIVCSALILSLPPIALRFFSSTSSAVWPKAETARKATATSDSIVFLDMNPPECVWTLADCDIRARRRGVASDAGHEVANSAADLARLGDQTVALGSIEEGAKGAIGIAALRSFAQDSSRIDSANGQPSVGVDAC